MKKHFRRSAHCTVVSGAARVRVGEREFELRRNESTYIPMVTVHRLENPTGEDLALIEVHAATTSARTTSCGSRTSTGG